MKTRLLGALLGLTLVLAAALPLAVSAADSKRATRAMEALGDLRGAELHSTVILSQVDTNTLRKLGINLTCEPNYQTKKLFHN